MPVFVAVAVLAFAACTRTAASSASISASPPKSSPGPYRFPWPVTRARPLAAGLDLGSTRPQAEAVLGPADGVAEIENAVTLLLYTRGLQVGVRQAVVEGVALMTPAAGTLDSIAVGMHPFVALNRWGEPTRLDSLTGSAVWSAPMWEIVLYLTPTGDAIRYLQLRRRREW